MQINTKFRLGVSLSVITIIFVSLIIGILASTSVAAQSIEITKIGNVYDGIKLQWESVENADVYKIFRAESGSDDFEEIKKTKSTVCSDGYENLKNSTEYTYKIEAFDESNKIAVSQEKDVEYNAYPHISSIENTVDGVKLNFSGLNQNNICIFKSDDKNADNMEKIKVLSSKDLFFVDTDVKDGCMYFYKIGINDKNTTKKISKAVYKQPSASVANLPVLKKIKNTPSGIQIVFEKPDESSKCRIYREEKGKWVAVGETNESFYMDNKNLKAQTTYKYTVACIDENGKLSSNYDKTGISIKWYPCVPVDSIENTNNGQKIYWKPIDGVKYYCVFVKSQTSKNWIELGFSSFNYIENKNVKNNVLYKYAIRPASNKNINSFLNGYSSKTVQQKVFFAPPQIKKIENVYKGQQISWTPVSGVSNYRIFVRNSESEKWLKLKDVSGSSFKNTNVDSNKMYYYTIRGIDKKGKFVTGYNSFKNLRYFKAPDVLHVYSDNEGMNVQWESIPGVKNYKVFYKSNTGSNNGWAVLGTFSTTSTKHKNLVEGKMYWYTVRCVDSKGKFVSGYMPGMYNTYKKRTSSATTTTTDTTIATSGKVLTPNATSLVDPNYKNITFKEFAGRDLTANERSVLENITTGEFGDDYVGSVYIAQCMRDAVVYGFCSSVESLPSEFGYDGYSAGRSYATDNAVAAVRYVFDEGGCGVQHRMLVMYNPTMCSSEWHESQTLIIDYPGYWGTVRFFDF